MTAVPVLWVSWHDEILVRGYADQGMLEEILARHLGSPPAALDFDHREVRGPFPDVEGAVVILPARHHVVDADRFLAELDRLRWSVVLLCGDEEWAFPWRRVVETRGATRFVWTMQPTVGHETADWRIPGGWYPGTREGVRGSAWADPALDVFFAGQITHERRQQLAAAMDRLPDVTVLGGPADDSRTSTERLDLAGLIASGARNVRVETAGYLQGFAQADYWQALAAARFVPCPSGPITVDTARALEAFEAGTVPIVDTRAPEQKPQLDYWQLCFGADFPAPQITDWADLPDLVERLRPDWTALANRCWAWWQAWRRDTVHALDAHVRAASGRPASADARTPDDQITVLVTTSPIPSHPSSHILAQTIDSIRDQLPDAEILVGIDGVRPEQEHLRDAYEQYQRTVLWLTNFAWHNVTPVRFDDWQHQANVTRALLERVETPCVLFVEHDTPIKGEIPWADLVRCVTDDRVPAEVIRLHHESRMLGEHRSVMLDLERRPIDDRDPSVQGWRTSAWWQRPHLASTGFYRLLLRSLFPPEARTMIEDRVYAEMFPQIKDDRSMWDRWRVWIYDPADGGSMQRSIHLDGRGDEPKYEMDYGLEGTRP